MSKPKPPPRRLWALFDAAGEMAGTYKTHQEADDDAVGPRFRPEYAVRAYDLVPVKQEGGELVSLPVDGPCDEGFRR